MTTPDPIGYAVVGLGWISQVAMLPAFANARESSRLSALVSGGAAKRRTVARRYDLPDDATFDYDDYDACLDREDVDAVYIAVPNHLHREYAVRAAEKGVHVLCEKPMAPSADDCQAMIDAAHANGVRLMTAYRLHLEPAHTRAIELVRAGAIGDPRIFNGTFALQVDPGNPRVMAPERGGGPLFDVGIYCLNAARYLFGDEPLRARAVASSRDEPRFEASPETMTCVLEFPGDRQAAFTCSFGAADVSAFRLVGTEGELGIVADAFEFRGDRELRVAGKEERTERFPTTDQFGPQLAYFSECIRAARTPEPDGEEGRIDVMIIRALHESAAAGRPVDLDIPRRDRRPGPDLARRHPPIQEPEMVGGDD